MTAKLAKFDFNQGFNRETTQYAEEGNWFDGDRVRFRAGRPENIRGYETRVSASFDGSARDLIAWKDNSNKKRAIFGTPDKLYEHFLAAPTFQEAPAASATSGPSENFSPPVASSNFSLRISIFSCTA